jgi:hypothetical protein
MSPSNIYYFYIRLTCEVEGGRLLGKFLTVSGGFEVTGD